MVTPNENLHDGKSGGERIAKVIARSGLCSRREAEALIEDRRVSVNGAVIDSAALDILPTDKVLVDGKPLAAREPPRLWRYHKPKGRVTTHKDPEGRPTVFEALPENLPRLISVGRLDFNTEGLLLLTNDGDLARHLELPSTGWTRRYRVRAYGQVSEEQLKELADGTTIDRMNYGPVEATLEREQGDNVWIAISIREGKNREVRRILENLGLTVNRLIRVSFGPFMLGELETGQIEEVKVAVLKDQLGPRLTRQLGVRREPLREERRLAPTRSKPSYLRRKPETGARPGWQGQADGGERPLKRRRIFDEGSAEAPKVEFVAEKPHFQKRGEGAGERTGDRPERPPFRSRGTGDGPGRHVSRSATRVRAGVPRGRLSAAVKLARVYGNHVSRGATRAQAGVPKGHLSAAEELARVHGSHVSRGATRAQAGVPKGRRSPAVELARGHGSRVSRGATRAQAGVPRGRRSAAEELARGRGNRVSRGATRAQAGVPKGRLSAAEELARVHGNHVSRGATRVPAGVPRGHRSAAVELARGRGNRVSRGATRVRAGVPRGRRSAAEEPARGRGNRVSRGATRVRAGVPKGPRSVAAKVGTRAEISRVSNGVAKVRESARRGRRSVAVEAMRAHGSRTLRSAVRGAGERAGRPPFRSRVSDHEGGDKPRFQRRGEGGAGRADRPPFRAREGGQEGGREERAPRFQGSPRGESGAGHGAESDRRLAPGARPEAGGWKPRTDATENVDTEGGGAPRFDRSGPGARSGERSAGRSTGDRPQRQGGDGKPFRSREGGERPAGRSTGDRPQRQAGDGKPFRSPGGWRTPGRQEHRR